MSLPHALLALLSGREMTGYEVSQQFGRSTAHVWQAPDSQIYPALRRLAEQGHLEVEEVDDGGRGTKKRYRVTDAGLDELRYWLASPTQYRRQRDPAYLKAAYLEWAEPAVVRELLTEHIAFHAEHLELLERTRATLLDGSHPTLARRLERHPVAEHEQIVAWKVFAYDGLIDQARTEIAWARRGLDLADRLAGQVTDRVGRA
ncbi:PadR family transcriptional regulator [Nocardioides mangrovicus]|uniref:PadR family transcriptional regulator n=1 Tax=Nocardioides mangrovicus TaxID=2478913 RepID=A0A3L8NZC6_9ACTN|nr:PadR family transcriptional regulator [Nocardioides mangrovicus]RLV48540.1 PadR family transcriptional regulator [Nocardioides mangrovicus]